MIEYKAKALKQDELRKRREEQQVEIRRQKREENIAKRRNFVATTSADSDEEASSGAWESPVRVISLTLLTCAHLLCSSTRT
jgi:importin subunit alpha-6/7